MLIHLAIAKAYFLVTFRPTVVKPRPLGRPKKYAAKAAYLGIKEAYAIRRMA